MRGLTRRMRDSDPDTVAALAVIEQFDDLLARGADLAEAVGVAEQIVGAAVFVRDDLNDRVVTSPGWKTEGCADQPATVPDHGAEDQDGSVVAPVSLAEGRVGVVWTSPLAGPSTELQHLAVERLASVVAVDSRRLASSIPAPFAGSALDELTNPALDDDAAAMLARRAGLPSGPLVALAARARAGISPDVVVAALRRSAGEGASATSAGHTVLVAAAPPAAQRLTSLLDDPGSRSWDVRIGVGPSGAAHELAAGWATARDALDFASDTSPLVRSEELGALALLSAIPTDLVLASADVVAVQRVAAHSGGDHDLTLLSRYCETGSLRETAAGVHRHHSSVDYRVKKIERELGFSLDTPRGRMRALLAVRLWQVHVSRRT